MDAESQQFERHLIALSRTVLQYENTDLLDDALHNLPLDTIYSQAEEAFQMHKAQIDSIGPGRTYQWGYQDFVIFNLVRYYSIPGLLFDARLTLAFADGSKKTFLLG